MIKLIFYLRLLVLLFIAVTADLARLGGVLRDGRRRDGLQLELVHLQWTFDVGGFVVACASASLPTASVVGLRQDR